jgi:serine/threonine protein kinase
LFLHRLAAVKEYFPEEWAQREETYVTVKKSKMKEAYRFGMKSFYQEVQIMAKFIHTPHVVTIYDVLEANDTVCYYELHSGNQHRKGNEGKKLSAIQTRGNEGDDLSGSRIAWYIPRKKNHP